MCKMLSTLSLILLPLFGSIIKAESTTDCSQLPRPIAPHSCCRFPELFPPSVLELCHKHTVQSKRGQCFYDCVFTGTEICVQGSCSVDKALDYIEWVMEPEDDFYDIFKDAYSKCIDKANKVRSNMVQRFKRNGCDPLPEMIYLCVQNEMFTTCPPEHWVEDDKDCSNKRNFIANCLRDQ